jgi:hypothetical protein
MNLARHKIELNNEENLRTGADIEVIEASPTLLTVLFRRGKGFSPGFVDAPKPRKVRKLLVHYSLSGRDLGFLRSLLAVARHDGCQVRLGREAGVRRHSKHTRVVTVRPG